MWADYVEFLCLLSCDGELSKADIGGRARFGIEDLDGELEFEDMHSDDPAEMDDNYTRMINDWFDYCRQRTNSFGECYPFYLEGGTLIRHDRLTDQQKLYIFLLLCSSLRQLDSRRDRNDLTSAFELVCYYALRSMMPESAEVYMFGKSSYNSGGEFSGNSFKKISRLAERLFEKVRCDEVEFSKQDTGDKGLDLVAWVPFPDDCPGALLVFGQCACGFEWQVKQHETGSDKWDKLLSLAGKPSRFTFIPHCFRNMSNGWYRDRDIETVVVDRQRIIFLTKNEYQSVSDKIDDHVVAIVDYSEPIF